MNTKQTIVPGTRGTKTMKFSKLLLASAIAMSASAFAMEDMTEDAMSDATGQDGLTIGINTPAAGISFGMNLYDTDAYGALANVGVLTIGATANKFKLTTPSAIILTIDAGSAAAGATPVLNVGIAIPANTVIHTGDIGVSGTATAKGAAARGVFGATVNNSNIMDDMTITLGATTATMQFGTGATNFLSLNTTMTGGGLNIANFALNDNAASGGGAVAATNVQVVNNGTAVASLATANLGIVATANVKAGALNTGGLLLTLGTVGNATGMDVYVKSLSLGAAALPVGDISLIGLNVNTTTVLISGH